MTERAPFACIPAQSRGRLHAEPASPTRSEFQRDRDRIIHSTAFRRLAHKTQVFVPHEGDHYRTRLTHTIVVAQIARALARALRLDDDLAEALALAHDLGHTPFGHSGEDALAACMAGFGGFDHNAHALRIVTELERRYASFDGLNLTWETLEGLVKHNGPLLDADGAPAERYRAQGVPAAILAYEKIQPLELATYAGGEAQCAAIADDIAYDAHDIDDGLRAGLFALEDLNEIAFIRELIADIAMLHPGLERARVIHELGRRIITRFVEDVIGEAARRLAETQPHSAGALRHARRSMVAFTPAMAAADRAIKAFLYPHVYRERRIMRIRAEADSVLRALFARYMEDPAQMPQEWAQAARGSAALQARAISDYIAGMTDRYALAQHRRLFGNAPTLT